MSKHLVHVGFAKAGSTFLQKWFREHPQLLYEPEGIAGFCSVGEISADRDPDCVSRYYVTSAEGLVIGWRATKGSHALELKQEGCRSDTELARRQVRICQTLSNIFPAARVLIVTRGYQGFIRSGYSEYVKFGGDWTFAQYTGIVRPLLLQALDINHLVRLYSAAFGEANVILLPYELLRDNRRGFIALLEERLGLDHHDIDPGRLNASLSPHELYWYPKISRMLLTFPARILSDRWVDRLYVEYSRRCVRPNRLRRPIKVLDRLFTQRKMQDSLPVGYLDAFKEKGTILRDNPLYADYAGEYLLDG